MKKYLIIILGMLVCSSAFADNYKYSIGFKEGFSTLSGSGDSFDKFTFQNSYGFEFSLRLKDRIFVNFDYIPLELYNDSLASSSFSFGLEKENATAKFKGTRSGITFSKMMGPTSNRLNLTFNFGGGMLIWKMVDPKVDSLYEVGGLHDEIVDFSATELFLTTGASLNVRMSSKWTLNWMLQLDYLSGAGVEFDNNIKKELNNWKVGSFISLKFNFGEFISGIEWKSRNTWNEQNQVYPPESIVNKKIVDGDNDGVPDEDDACLNTPTGAVVGKDGCSIDTDYDGIPDGLDDCPGTDRLAAGYVDIFGCPVDSDFDGLPDYKDQCPTNQVGAHVDENGCPIDSDGDGVPDGIDDCNNTLYGVDVDKFGCIDLSMLAQPMILNIDYAPGSFEIDPKNRDRLKSLVRILNFVSEINMEINGYTDNIGTTVANQKLSEKRARRVLDFLVNLGIDKNRMKAFGKGETNFIASNDTAAGRAKNRRIEIIFYK